MLHKKKRLEEKGRHLHYFGCEVLILGMQKFIFCLKVTRFNSNLDLFFEMKNVEVTKSSNFQDNFSISKIVLICSP